MCPRVPALLVESSGRTNLALHNLQAAPMGSMLLGRPDDEYIFKLGTHEPLIISELGIKTCE